MDERARRSRRSRWALRGLVVAALLVVIVGALSSVSSTGLQEDILATVGVLAFTAVGAVILERRPGEPVGRICLGVGLTYGVATILRLVSDFMDGLPGPITPTGAALAVIGSTIASVALLLSGPLLISRFPVRAPARWQRRLEDLFMGLVSLIVIAGATKPGFLDISLRDAVENPLGLDWMPADSDALFLLAVLAYATASLVATVGLVRRYVQGRPVVRAQIRWFAGSIAVSLATLLLMIASSGNEALSNIAWALWTASLLLPPIAIAIAILRYRLYDIDRIVSNAIGYGVVTIVLFTVFAGVNVVLVSQLSPLVNNEGIAVAASTLLVAALFNPLRTRVQRVVDRRFHRARYDADEMVQAFAASLRDELDLATLVHDLAAITTRAVEPTAAALWLRAHGPVSSR